MISRGGGQHAPNWLRPRPAPNQKSNLNILFKGSTCAELAVEIRPKSSPDWRGQHTPKYPINQTILSSKEPDQALDYYKDEYLKSIEGAKIDFNFLSDSEDLESIIKGEIEKENPDYIVIDNLAFNPPIDEYSLEYSNNTELIKQLIVLQKEKKKFFLIATALGHDAWFRSGNKKHNLEDLHSTLIDENSDLVLMLHRADLYGIDVDENGNSLKGIIEVDCVLNRYGKEGNTSDWIIDEGIPKLSKNDC